MDIFEIEQKETLTRKEIATRLRRLANLLASDDEEVSFERGGMKFSVQLQAESSSRSSSRSSPTSVSSRSSSSGERQPRPGREMEADRREQLAEPLAGLWSRRVRHLQIA